METIKSLLDIREYFDQGNTQSYQFRKEQLLKLKSSIIRHEQDFFNALYTDLKKNPEECWVTENGMVLSELNYALKKLKS